MNPGIIPIELGPAKLEHSYHNFIHYYSLEEVFNQLSNLDKYYKNVTDCINVNYSLGKNTEFVTDNSSKLRDIINYMKFINHSKSLIEEKLEIICIENSNSDENNYLNNVRNRRGIVNGLGSVVKLITGNLDAYDGERYEELFYHIKNNQNNIMNQLANQYSVNMNIMAEFNKTVDIVRNNFNELKDKLLYVNKRVNSIVELEKVKDLMNQLHILYNIILGLVREIENSLTFCKLGILHPSIISTSELFHEIRKISKYYTNQLPFEPNIKHMWEFENLIKVSCSISNKEIIYVMKLPIVENLDFKLYKLYPVPTVYESNYVTIIPKVKYLLKSDPNSIKQKTIGLSNDCSNKIKSKYLCSSETIVHNELICENSIIQTGSTANCKYTAVEIDENSIRWVPEIHQFLAVFPNKETLKINNQAGAYTKNLQGIYLINPNHSQIIYKNKELLHSTESKGHPKFLDATELRLQLDQQPEFSVNLKSLELDQINLSRMSVISEKAIVITKISIWTIILYIMFIICILSFVYYYVYYKIVKSVALVENQNAPDVLFRGGGVIE